MNILKNMRRLAQFHIRSWGRYGWHKSWWKNRPIDADGQPLPWLTYPAIDFLSQFNFKDTNVFEWGSGFSTLWWRAQGASITSVESNAKWIPYIRKLLPTDVNLIETPFNVEAELEAFARYSIKYDVIVVDNHGPFRWRCCEVAPQKLEVGGIIILDNSDQCPRAWAVLKDQGFTAIDFTGFAPSASYAQTTTLFFKDFELKRLPGDQPKRSVAQPNPPWENC